MAINAYGGEQVGGERTSRRLFITVQASKAAIGAALGVAFIAMIGRPDPAELIAMAGLLAPAVLALLGFTRISLPALETIAIALFAGLIGYLSALTGGVLSPLVVWFALVPAEAALSGGRPAVQRAAVAAAISVLLVAAIEWGGALPAVRRSGR